MHVTSVRRDAFLKRLEQSRALPVILGRFSRSQVKFVVKDVPCLLFKTKKVRLTASRVLSAHFHFSRVDHSVNPVLLASSETVLAKQYVMIAPLASFNLILVKVAVLIVKLASSLKLPVPSSALLVILVSSTTSLQEPAVGTVLEDSFKVLQEKLLVSPA